MSQFGVTTTLALSDFYYSNAGSAMKVTPTEAGIVSKFSVYLRNTSASTCATKVALFTHDAGNDRPNALVAYKEVTIPGSQAAGWQDYTLTTPTAFSNAIHWLCWNQANDGVNLDYSTTGGTFRIDDVVTYSTWPPSTWAAVDYSYNWQFAINATYSLAVPTLTASQSGNNINVTWSM